MKISEKHYASVKYFFYLAAFLAIFSYLQFLAKAILTSKFTDFANYYAHTKLLFSGYNIWEQAPSLAGKINLVLAQYNIETMCTGVAMHSVGFFLIVYPFSLIPFKIASILWVILCQIALASSLILIYKMRGVNNKLLILSGLFLVFYFWPIREDLFLGQPNCLILFFLTLALCFLKKDRLLLAGLFLGIGIQIKEIFFPLLFFLLIKNTTKRCWQR